MIKEVNADTNCTIRKKIFGKEFDPFDDSAEIMDEDIQYLKRCIELCNKGKRLNRSQNAFGDIRNVVINISGIEFRTQWNNLKKFPKSRLGKISLGTSLQECSDLCDGFIPGAIPVIFFHRNPQNFRSIFDIYRGSELHICEQTCAIVAQKEFEFWGVEEYLLQPCCMLKYFPTTVSAKKEMEEETIESQQYEERVQDEDFGNDNMGRLRTFLWDLFEYPETSRAAQALSFLSVFLIVLSTVTLMVESTLEDDVMEKNLDDTEAFADDQMLWILKSFDKLAILFFTMEYVVRLALCPRKKKFLLNKMNLVDLIAIIPFFLSLLLSGLEDMQIIGKAGKLIRLMRIMRILRIFKMVRHFVGLQSLIYTLHMAYKQLGLILIIIAVTVLMFSALVFAFERDGPDPSSWSFYDCIWWALFTLTTVGYYLQPSTFLGKLACGLCALCGIFILTLPIPIVVSNFAVIYKSKLWRNEILTRKRLMKGKSDAKSEILFNLSKSSGMSGVRKPSEVLPPPSPVEDLEELEKLAVSHNKILLQSLTQGISPTELKKIEPRSQGLEDKRV